MNKYLSLLILTIVSGYLSANIEIGILSFGPGIIFGLALGTWFLLVQKTNPIKTTVWFLMSTLAYYAAIQSFFYAGSLISNEMNAPLFLIAGLVGALILAIATHSLIAKLNAKKILLLILLGGLAGLTFNITYLGDNYSFGFILWQVTIGLALGIMTSRDKIVVIEG